MNKKAVSIFLKILTAIIALIALVMISNGKAIAQNVEPRLKSNPSISGPNITIGDIFDNAGVYSSRVLARAPSNGQRMVFSASALQARAASFGMRWTNPDGVRQIAIGGGSNISATTPGLGATPLANNQNGPEIAVLNRDVAKNEVITSDMISWINAQTTLPQNSLTQAEQLIGNSAKRNIRARTPVTQNDIGPTMAVQRGQFVTLVHEAGGLRITLRGRALTDGIIGGSIRVVNLQSNKTLDAIVESDGVARVLMPSTSAQVGTNRLAGGF